MRFLLGTTRQVGSACASSLRRPVPPPRHPARVHRRAIDPAVLDRVLRAAHAAPSVGLSQPWDFILVSDDHVRREFRDQRAGRAQGVRRLPRSERAAVFDRIKIEGVLESSLGVVVCLRPGARLAGRARPARHRRRRPVLGVPGHRETCGWRPPPRAWASAWVSFYRRISCAACSACPPASARWPGCALRRAWTCPMFPIWSDTGGGNGCHSMTLSTMSGTVSGQAGSLARVEPRRRSRGRRGPSGAGRFAQRGTAPTAGHARAPADRRWPSRRGEHALRAGRLPRADQRGPLGAPRTCSCTGRRWRGGCAVIPWRWSWPPRAGPRWTPSGRPVCSRLVRWASSVICWRASATGGRRWTWWRLALHAAREAADAVERSPQCLQRLGGTLNFRAVDGSPVNAHEISARPVRHLGEGLTVVGPDDRCTTACSGPYSRSLAGTGDLELASRHAAEVARTGAGAGRPVAGPQWATGCSAVCTVVSANWSRPGRWPAARWPPLRRSTTLVAAAVLPRSGRHLRRHGRRGRRGRRAAVQRDREPDRHRDAAGGARQALEQRRLACRRRSWPWPPRRPPPGIR